MSKQKITMTIDKKIFLEFKKLCKKNGMKVSSRVEIMMAEFSKDMKKDMKGKK